MVVTGEPEAAVVAALADEFSVAFGLVRENGFRDVVLIRLHQLVVAVVDEPSSCLRILADVTEAIGAIGAGGDIAIRQKNPRVAVLVVPDVCCASAVGM